MVRMGISYSDLRPIGRTATRDGSERPISGTVTPGWRYGADAQAHFDVCPWETGRTPTVSEVARPSEGLSALWDGDGPEPEDSAEIGLEIARVSCGCTQYRNVTLCAHRTFNDALRAAFVGVEASPGSVHRNLIQRGQYTLWAAP